MATSEINKSILIRDLNEKTSTDDENIMVIEDSSTTYKISIKNIINSFTEKLKTTFITVVSKGVANGVAPLNANAKIPSTHIIYGNTADTAYEGSKGQANADAIATHAANTSNPHKVTKSQVGLGNVENKSSATIRDEITSANVTSALGYTPEKSGAVATAKAYTDQKITDLIGGADSTLDTLKEIGDAIASADNVIEALDTAVGKKADNSTVTTHINNTTIHMDATLKKQLATAYEYSQAEHANVDASVVKTSVTNGMLNINGTDETVYQHPNSGIAEGTYQSVTVDVNGHVVKGSNAPVPITQGGTGALNSTQALSNLGFTATIAELNTLDGITASVNELNNTQGTTSNIQKQLDDKASLYHGEHIPTISNADNGSFVMANNGSVAWHSLSEEDIISALGYKPGTGDNVYIAVKGDAETTYRVGNVNITPANIGLGKVSNTSDTEKSVYSATKLTTGRKIGNATFNGTNDITLTDIGAQAVEIISSAEPTNQSVGSYWISEI